jgi:hypothetical protein
VFFGWSRRVISIGGALGHFESLLTSPRSFKSNNDQTIPYLERQKSKKWKEKLRIYLLELRKPYYAVYRVNKPAYLQYKWY